MASAIDIHDPEGPAHIQIFKDIPAQALHAELIHCQERRLEAGEILLSPERENQCIYILLAGRLTVYLDTLDSPPLTSLAPGECAGEMSILGQRSPSAYVVASEPSRLLAIEQSVLWELIERWPKIARNLLSILAARVRFGHSAIMLREQFANLDALTGLYNRRWLETVFSRTQQRAQRAGKPLCLIMADVDHFKRFNDRYGHLAGDQALCAVAKSLSAQLRTSDKIARYGGEEFAILLPDTALQEALAVAERLCQAVSQTSVQVEGLHALPSVTISLGVAQLAVDESLSALIARADAALYRAKANGRNCVSE